MILMSTENIEGKRCPWKINLLYLTSGRCKNCTYNMHYGHFPFQYLSVNELDCTPRFCRMCSAIDREKVDTINKKLAVVYKLKQVL